MRKLTFDELQQIAGGGDPQGQGNGSKLHADNGWGNGADSTNAGSFSGGTAPSKSTNSSQPDDGKINTNPTTSDGR
jgi:hypothetical protein